jgi:hypothetical protein
MMTDTLWLTQLAALAKIEIADEDDAERIAQRAWDLLEAVPDHEIREAYLALGGLVFVSLQAAIEIRKIEL